MFTSFMIFAMHTIHVGGCVREGGPEALARAWSGPESLPSTAELEQPELWSIRVGGAAA